jgi:hypothetical protein
MLNQLLLASLKFPPTANAHVSTVCTSASKIRTVVVYIEVTHFYIIIKVFHVTFFDNIQLRLTLLKHCRDDRYIIAHFELCIFI